LHVCEAACPATLVRQSDYGDSALKLRVSFMTVTVISEQLSRTPIHVVNADQAGPNGDA